jgi:ABC-type nitrate/sulfonate/bicarbonate transport system permease component
VPPISYIPLALIWFGLSETSIIFIIVAGAFWPMFLNTVAGIRATQPLLVRAAQALGTGRWELVRRVYLPSAFPQIFTGLRVSFGLAWSAVVAAELIGASAGIGYLVMHARLIIATPDVVAGMAAIGVVGALFDAGLVAAERRIFAYRRR